jgi:cyclohexyl-isocyanide hydratase
MVAFPNFTQLDLTGPFEVLGRLPNTEVLLIGETTEVIKSDTGLQLLPNTDFAHCPQLDVLFVPGGPGIDAALENAPLLEFLQRQAAQAQYITAVCTGSLVLAAAGLLQGYRATTHWLSLDLLALLGVTVVRERIVIDRNRLTGGGVTAGIDFALALAAQLRTPTIAQEVQLVIEYNPAPPFVGGSPQTAPPDLVNSVINNRQGIMAQRRAIVERVKAKLATNGSSQ